MIYSNSDIKRQDRLMDEESAKILLKQGEYGFLSMQAEQGGGYGIPTNYAWDGIKSIYLHCAPEGRKLQCIELCNKVSFCIVGKTNVVSNKFSTGYKSIILECTAFKNLVDKEKMNALLLLLDKYSPMDKEKGIKYAEKSFDRTEILRLDIHNWSGKCKNIKS